MPNFLLTSESVSLINIFKNIGLGGWFIVIIILILSIMSVYIFIERIIAINKASKRKSSFINHIKDFVYESKDFHYVNYEHKSEWKLIRKLLRFDEVIISIEKDLMPNRLCNYLFELCQTFNRFYDQVPILKEEKNIKISRLNLCDLTAKTLKLSLELLGIETLERM